MRSSLFSTLSMIVGAFFLIYLWLPLFFVLVGFVIVYVIFSYIFAKITGRPINIVRVYRTSDMHNDNNTYQRIDNDDVIDSTTADKDKS